MQAIRAKDPATEEMGAARAPDWSSRASPEWYMRDLIEKESPRNGGERRHRLELPRVETACRPAGRASLSSLMPSSGLGRVGVLMPQALWRNAL